jgi:hypothetical protein
VTPDGTVYTTLTTTKPEMKFAFDKIVLNRSKDGGQTWTQVSTVADNIPAVPGRFANTTFRDGIENSFATGSVRINGHYPLYVTWEDYSAGVDNVLLSVSFDDGATWAPPIQVNDNQSLVDEFQPNLATSANGRVSVNFYDRRLTCPGSGTGEAAAAGIALDQSNAAYTGSLPPYGAANYCVNASIQFYDPQLNAVGHNIRLTQHTWDPQLNALHTRCATCVTTFIGDYFGNTLGDSLSYSTFVSTYDDGSNPQHYQQQVVAMVTVP